MQFFFFFLWCNAVLYVSDSVYLYFFLFSLKTSSVVILEVNGEEYLTPVFVAILFFLLVTLFFVVIVIYLFICIEICECECSTIYKDVHYRVEGRRAQGRVHRMQCLLIDLSK